jgi:hypothetical protein
MTAATNFELAERIDEILLVQDEYTNLPCDCGRGPILEGNGTPDVCAACYDETALDECKGHPAGPNDPMGVTVYCDGSCQ